MTKTIPDLWYGTTLTQVDTEPSARHSVAPLAASALLAAVYAWLFGWLSIQEYESFSMHALDMGNMAQAAWNTIHGHPFYFTNMRLAYNIEAWKTTTRLSFHVEPLFPLISLVYLISARPESLLVLQTLAIASGAIAVFLLARDILRSAWLGVIFVVAYLLFPSLEAMNLYEFHPVSLATPLLLFAFLFAWRRQWVPFFLCSLAAMGTKEEIGLIVAMMGLYVAVVRGDRKVGLWTAVIGVFWSLFAVFVVERHFREPGSVSYLHTRYGYLGHGLHGVIHTVLYNPGVFRSVLFTWPKLGYLQRLFAPVGFLCLLSPAALLIGAPTFAINLFSQDLHMVSGLGDNSAELISVIMIAAIVGVRHVLDLSARWMRPRTAMLAIASYVLVMAVWNQHVNGFTPFGAYFQVPGIGPHQHVEARFVSMIPPGVPVSTQDELDPHLANRQYLYLFEDTGRLPPPPLLPEARYILLDAAGPTYPLQSFELHDRAQTYIRQPGWGIKAADDGLILIAKGATSKRVPPSFYSFLNAGGVTIRHHLHLQAGGLELLGYDVSRSDLANHRVPNLNYTFYMRPLRRIRTNMQPVVFERMDGQTIGTQCQPLGLAWLPTSQWQAGHTYKVTMEPIETNWRTPGTAKFYVELWPSSPVPTQQCGGLWSMHGPLASVGSLTIQF